MAMRRSNIAILILMILGIIVLCGLGTWQLQRLAWKNELINTVTKRSTAAPIDLSKAEKLWQSKKDIDYQAITLTGTYDAKKIAYFYTTWNGQSGWDILLPVDLKDQRSIIVKAGFVPAALKERFVMPTAKSNVTFKALARNPLVQKPNSMMPDNNLNKGEFYWRSYDELSKVLGNNGKRKFLPFLADAQQQLVDGKYPQSATTRIHFVNSHLQYAFTWFGLAATLFAVGSMFLYQRTKAQAANPNS